MNVWGGGEPEALVSYSSGGQGCCSMTAIAIPSGSPHILLHNFGQGWRGQRRGGGFQFVSSDGRFSCAFTSCATSILPLKVLKLDSTGRRLLDVTRTRRQAIEEQAGVIWNLYLSRRTHPIAGNSAGELAAWCADQWRLARKSRCAHAVDEAIKRNYLGDDGRAVTRIIYARLSAWGYGSKPG
jgi:hypothetical protein